jgi:tripartite-type tricarboxylate transporter receptor subunit TctC
MVRDGRAKAIGITSLKRFKEFPDLPTLSESGAPGYKFEFWYGLLAPANTPKEILAQIASEVKRINELADVKERYQSLGIEPVSGTPEQFDKLIENEIKDLTRVAKLAKISAD